MITSTQVSEDVSFYLIISRKRFLYYLMKHTQQQQVCVKLYRENI
jgi:hypothetical protein